MSGNTLDDSPLSITASVAGILTFVYAVAASAFGYAYLFRSSTQDSIERFYEAFSACALESDLVRRDILRSQSTLSSSLRPTGSRADSNLDLRPPLRHHRAPAAAASYPSTASSAAIAIATAAAAAGVPDGFRSAPGGGRPEETAMAPIAVAATSASGPAGEDEKSTPLLASVSSLGPRMRRTRTSGLNPAAAEESIGLDGATNPYLLDPDSLGRLFQQVRAVEIELQNQAAKVVRARPRGEDGMLATLLGRGRWATRAKELEASLGKREALTARLLVVQMSLMSAKMSSQVEFQDRLVARLEENEAEIKDLHSELAQLKRPVLNHVESSAAS